MHAHKFLGALLLTSLALASSAVAGPLLANDPFETMDCGNIGVGEDIMPDAAGYFAGLSDCRSLCAKAAAECKKLVNRVSGCQLDQLSGQELFDSRNCSQTYTEPTLIKACKASVKASIAVTRFAYRDGRAFNLDLCGLWRQTCQDSCTLQ
jgi:hypothetical protein